MSVRTITITDPALLAQLEAADGPIAFQGPDGRTVRWVETVPVGQHPASIRSPISDEEFEKLRQQPDGVPLAEMWKRIHERYGQ